MISLSGDFYVTVTFQSATFQIITRRERPIRIIRNHSDFDRQHSPSTDTGSGKDRRQNCLGSGEPIYMGPIKLGL